jgi:hypothetical protein
VLRHEEAAGQVLGLLIGLDAVKVMLPVETLLPSSIPEGVRIPCAGTTEFAPLQRSEPSPVPLRSLKPLAVVYIV